MRLNYSIKSGKRIFLIEGIMDYFKIKNRNIHDFAENPSDSEQAKQ
jgi:hypothetical protein